MHVKEKARESRMRREMLQRGYRITKSRQRNHGPNSDNCGDYMVIDAAISHVVLGKHFNATLDDIEAFLKQA
jgi:hypothetical protein